MPLITLTVQKPKSAQFKDCVFAAVHQALVACGVPATDQFQRVIELDAENFRVAPSYPDLERPRDDNFVMIEILLSAGRGVKVKKQMVESIVATLSAQDFDPEHVMIYFVETTWENWSFGGARFFYM